MTLNAVIKCLDKDELDVTLKLKLANTYNDDKIIKVLYCLVLHLVFKRYVPSKIINLFIIHIVFLIDLTNLKSNNSCNAQPILYSKSTLDRQIVALNDSRNEMSKFVITTKQCGILQPNK